MNEKTLKRPLPDITLALASAETLAAKARKVAERCDGYGILQCVLTEFLFTLEAVPITESEMCYFRNRASDSVRMAYLGEWGTAFYLTREMHRKVQRVQEAIA